MQLTQALPSVLASISYQSRGTSFSPFDELDNWLDRCGASTINRTNGEAPPTLSLLPFLSLWIILKATMLRTHPLLILLFTTFFTAGSASAAPNDVDGDGVSDLITVAADSGGKLRWSAIGSTSEDDELDTLFGLSTDLPAAGNWSSEDETELVVVRERSSSNSLVWKRLLIDRSISEVTFGKPGDLLVAGADFNGDGISDAAAVSSDPPYQWRFRTGLFSRSPRSSTFRLGRSGDRVTILRASVGRDWAAVFGAGSGKRSRLELRRVGSQRARTFNSFPLGLSGGARPRPFGIRQENGIDAVGFITEDETDTTLRVYTLRGRSIRKVTFPGKGSFVVGEFLRDEEGFEVALRTETELILYNPFTGAKVSETPASGTLVPAVTVRTFGVTAAPTATPAPDGDELE